MALMLLVALTLAAVGCGAKPAQWSELGSGGGGGQTQQSQPRQQQQPSPSNQQQDGVIRIVPLSNQEVADLSPDDVVTVMRWIGFTDKHIIQLGAQMHRALLQSGGARIVYQGETEAQIAINRGQVYVTSRSRGSFIHDLGVNPFGAPTPRR
jgi:hypothetical protein